MKRDYAAINCTENQGVFMNEGSWYNGFNPKQRNDKLREMKRKIANGELPPASGPCALCGDTGTEVEYHDEDYAIPYRWVEPAMYVLCLHCHRHQLHRRFTRPIAWQAFLAHVRRGGYGRDLNDPSVTNEYLACCKAIEAGEAFALRKLRPYKRIAGEEWFARLRLVSESEYVAGNGKSNQVAPKE